MLLLLLAGGDICNKYMMMMMMSGKVRECKNTQVQKMQEKF